MSGNSEDSAYDDGASMWSDTEPGEEVVISGIAGRFPESDNITDFQENLFNKSDLVTGDGRRWQLDHPEIPQRTGKINDVGKFDSLFFGVHFKQAHTLDPMCRMLLEHAYEAIIDAGVNPRQLRGSNTGVFIGACFSESEKTWFYEKLQVNGFGITGCSRAMLANRVSYWLGSNGPSYTVDSACSSSLFALDHAYRAIRSGQCDAALVGGANLCLHPYVSLQFSRLGVLSADGRCKSFDADADGYSRSETVAMIFLQKSKDAKRIYSRVIHTKTNCDGYKEQGVTYPSSVMQVSLLEKFYKECGVPPSLLSFVEAHGAGSKTGDLEELTALEKIFCPGRTTPLQIGSIKSNLGHSEPASGLCSVAKVIVGMESGFIPPNLHYNRPCEGAKALEDGRIRVITESTPWEGGYVGVNSFGFGGANCHVLLESNPKEKVDGGKPKDDLPRLVVVSGRTEEAVTTLLDGLEKRPVDVEYISLFHGIHAEEIPGHLYRGYTILPSKGIAENKIRDVQHYPGAKRPVWFVFSGMGSQWAGMGEALLKIPVFARAIEICDAALKPRGVDIIDILTNKDPKTFDNILNSFVGIAAVQIGLVDVLKSIGIEPTNIIGHSVGELGCAYADGCFTAEQMVLAAYSRGLASIETELIRGSMAAVGLGYNDIKVLCPPDIEVACHNGPESSTISGPADSMKEFVTKLQANNIFAREVPCSNIAYHSRYIAAAGTKLLAYLEKVIPNPKPRSEKWLSSSVPRNKWNTSAAQLCSAEYHTNNLLSPVLFEETSRLIPKNAITIEIAPHGLLQAILRRSLDENVTNIALTKRGHKDNAEVLLQAIGKMYEVGLHPHLANLYPKVEYPVSRGTPGISSLIRWEHTDDWYVTSYRMQEKIISGERVVQITLSDERYKWMAGHVIDGRNLIPPTSYLSLIWETMGIMRGELYTEVSVVFEDIKFHRAVSIPKDDGVELTLMLQRGSGRFEVVENGTAVVTGLARAVSSPGHERISAEILVDDNEELELTSRDIYEELRLRGYQYAGVFRGLKGSTLKGRSGSIEWNNNWVAFMDNMLQMHVLGLDTRELFVPTAIQKLVIDTQRHSNTENTAFPVHVDRELNIVVSGGVEIRGLKVSAIARKKSAGDPVLEEFHFVAHRDRAEISLEVATRLATHIALDNYLGVKVQTIEVIGEESNISPGNLTSPLIQEVLSDLPRLQADVNILAPIDIFEQASLPSTITISDVNKLSVDHNALLVVGHGLLANKDSKTWKQVRAVMKDGSFLLAREPLDADSRILSTINREGFDVVLEKRTKKELVLLLHYREKLPEITAVIKINNNEFTWLSKLQAALKAENEKENSIYNRILVVSEGDFESGLMGLVNCLRKEAGGGVVQGLLIQDLQAPKFSLDNPFYAEQLQLGLSLNVLRPRKTWGSYRFFKLDPLPLRPVYHAQIHQPIRGNLSSLMWTEGMIQPSLGHQNLIKIDYASINFRDVMLTTGKLPIEITAKTRQSLDNVIGFEFSGRDMNGQRVMGIIENGAMSNLCFGDKELLWPVPDEWTLEDAATVPAAYVTAYYALEVNGRMQKGDRVLIHAGSGGVGQAAITIALRRGCEVFTTVGSPQKREFVKKQFPQIDDDHIGNSRDTSFEQLVLRQTRGQGVDIVLNSLAEEKLQASVRCLAYGGRFLEIGKFDFVANNSLGMEVFLKEISFHGILLDNLFAGTREEKLELVEILNQGIRSGAVKPLVRTVFPMDQVEAAFRYMAAGKHIGKVILKIRDTDDVVRPFLPLALPRYYCLEDCSYLILGGLGGFGLELADWLVLRGAKKIVLTSRRGISNGYQKLRIDLWKSYGVKVVVIAGKDASIHEDCEAILKQAAALGPVDAIFNLTVVLKDALCESQTPKTFEESLRAKAWSTKRLDKLSRILCPDLRQFVVFSSVSCGRGNAGQTNYGMANSVIERICETRAAENLPGLAIQWGAIGDVGSDEDVQEEFKEDATAGTLQQKISSCLQELDGFLHREHPVVSSMVVAGKRTRGSGVTNIIDAVTKIIGLKDPNTVSLHSPLTELGMDSMMAVELKQTLEREFELFMTAQDIRALNFTKVQEMSDKQVEQERRREQTASDQTVDLGGLKMLIRTLSTDELDTNICVPLLTKAEDGRGEVFILPGIESTHIVFQSLASKLKFPTTCLQLAISSDLLSVDDMVDYLISHVKARLKGRRDFVIAGYSFGSLLAIELVRRLESEGLHGRLVLFDGSPEYMKAIISQHLSSETDDQLQSNILLGIMDMLAPSVTTELLEELKNCSDWSQRFLAFSSKLPKDKNLNFTHEDQEAICTSIYYRLRAIVNYDCSTLSPLRTPITLLRPKIQAVRSMSEDYGLQALTREKVEVRFVAGNHVTMLDDDICASAINGDPLEDAASFKKSIMEDGANLAPISIDSVSRS